MQGIYELLFSGQAAHMELAYLLAQGQGWNTAHMKRRLEACVALMEKAHRLPLTPLRFVELLRDNRYGLALNACRLKDLPEELDFLTPVLLGLELNGNDLEQIPPVVFRLRHLQRLHLAGNPLYELPDELWQLQYLEVLDLSHTSIEELPEQIAGLKRLSHLSLAYAPLKYLPGALADLPLEELSYGMDEGFDLPEVLYRCRRLLRLDLVGRGLYRLKEDIAGWSNLEELDLRSTGINELPEALGRLTRLRQLRLYDVPLRSLPACIGNLKNLQTIVLQGCPTAFFPESLALLPRLEQIVVSHPGMYPHYWTGPYPLGEQQARIQKAAPQVSVKVDFGG